MNTDQSFTFDARSAGLININTKRPGVDQLKCSEIYRSIPSGRQFVNYVLGLTVCGSANTLLGANICTLAGGRATTGTLTLTQRSYICWRRDLNARSKSGD